MAHVKEVLEELREMKMHLAAIADRRLVDPHQYEKEADYVLKGWSKIPFLLRRVAIRF